MSKQDRHGIRSPAEFERKHSRVLTGKDDTNASQTRQIEQLSQSIEGNTSSFNYSITTLNARLSRVEEDVSALQGDTTASVLMGRMDTVEQRLSSLDEVYAEQQEIITSLLTTISTLETTVSGLAARLTTVENTLSALSERVTALEG